MATKSKLGRMVDQKKKKPANTDKAQSERFKEFAKELEADGDLNLTEAEEKLEEAFVKQKESYAKE